VAQRTFFSFLAISLTFLTFSASAHGKTKQQRAEALLPDHTAAMLSIADRAAMDRDWKETQLGHLIESPELRPFVQQVRQKTQGELNNLVEYIGADWGVANQFGDGATVIAMVQPNGPKSVAFVLLAEITVDDAERNQVLSQLGQRLISLGAVATNENLNGASATVYRHLGDNPTGNEVVHAVADGWFVASSDRQTAASIVSRIRNSTGASLANTKQFRAILRHTSSADEKESVRWFVHPIRFAQASRTLTSNGERGGSILRAISNQGFDALQGIGGSIYLAKDEFDIRHSTFVYRDGELKKGAKILDFPNGTTLHPQGWTAPHTANYISFRWRMKEAFENLQPLVDEIAEDAVFERMLSDIKEDSSGPQLDIRGDIVAHFGERVTIVTACDHPVKPTSHQMFAAIDLTDGDSVAYALNKALERDPKSAELTIAGRKVWELGQQVEDEEDIMTLTIEVDGGVGVDGNFGLDGGFGVATPPAVETVSESEEAELPKVVLGVIGQQLIISSSAGFAEYVFAHQAEQEALAEARDYRRVDNALRTLGCEAESLRVFSRTDEAYHSTYELLRRGESLESGSLLGRLVSEAIGPSEDVPTTIDGSALPDFEFVRPFLGPAGMSMESVADGWLLRGCLLRKE
jgi:hypothetical protein